MCRYSQHPAKTHLVCLTCCATFKYERGVVGFCPMCGEVMWDAGRDFKAPRRGDRNQWKKIYLLASHGVSFDSCGCGHDMFRPKTLGEAKRLIEAARDTGVDPGKALRARRGVERGKVVRHKTWVETPQVRAEPW
jgi:predicted RNA-binding Zn-ribbon protein involved in translation (DUF1610 family)